MKGEENEGGGVGEEGVVSLRPLDGERREGI